MEDSGKIVILINDLVGEGYAVIRRAITLQSRLLNHEHDTDTITYRRRELQAAMARLEDKLFQINTHLDRETDEIGCQSTQP